MKVYLRRADNFLNVDDVFLTPYDIESILPETITMVVWDTEEQAGLKFFSEFAKDENGYMPPPEEFTILGVCGTAENYALGAYDSHQNPVFYYRTVEYIDSDSEQTYPVGLVYTDVAYPKLAGPPADHTDVVPPGVLTDAEGIQFMPNTALGSKEGRYLQWTGTEFVMAAYDITKTIAAGKTEVLNKIKKRLAEAVNNELSIYSQVELIEAADIRALAPAYRSEATIGDVITALDATVATLVSDTNSATTHAALRAIDPLS